MNGLLTDGRSDSLRRAGATWKRVKEFADKPVVFDGGIAISCLFSFCWCHLSQVYVCFLTLDRSQWLL
jgi:hypothetical protein